MKLKKARSKPNSQKYQNKKIDPKNPHDLVHPEFNEFFDLKVPDFKLARHQQYLGNSNIKRAGVKLNLTKEHIEEFIRCSQDIIYFTKKYMKIVNMDEGLVPFELYDYQNELLRSFTENRFNVTVIARQSGKTSTATAFLLHYVLFNEFKNVAILANKGDTARDILQRIQLAYEHLPKWLQIGAEEWNKGSAILENGCNIYAASTSSSSIRGKSVSCLYIDEAAFIDNWDDFFQSVYPTISSSRTAKLFLVSTPNGMNHFYQMVQLARLGESEYVLHEYDWRCVPNRDEAWAKKERSNTTKELWEQEYECRFIGSSRTLLSSDALKLLKPIDPKEISLDGCFKIYKQPAEEHIYAMTVDIAEGVLKDYSTISVIDITSLPYRQVAVYRSNQISPMLFPSVIAKIGKQYNNAYALIEKNSVGFSVLKDLTYEQEYENILRVKMEDDNKSLQGMRTTNKSKLVGCSRLKDMMESNSLIVQDRATIRELFTFVEGKGSFVADKGETDDIVMGLVNFAYFSVLPQFQMLTDEQFKTSFIGIMNPELQPTLPSRFWQVEDKKEEYMEIGNQKVIVRREAGGLDPDFLSFLK